MIIERIVNNFLSSNTYVLYLGRIAFCIDCGDVDAILKVLPPKSILKGVFLTHTHIDHIYGLKELLNLFPNCLVYTSDFGTKALGSSKINLSKYHENIEDFELQINNVCKLCDGDSIELFGENYVLTVLQTPGHDESCLTYRMGNVLFTGDSYIPGLKTVTTFPHSNKKNADISIMRILRLLNECDIYPGHGEIVKSFKD